MFRTMSIMTYHLLHGNKLYLEKWRMVYCLEFGIRIEETLVSPAYIEVVMFHPKGLFQCGCCRKEDVPFEKHVHVDRENKCLLCPECYQLSQVASLPVDQLCIKYDEVVEGYVEAGKKLSCIEFVDQRYQDFEEHMGHYQTFAKNVADANDDLIYLGGKDMHMVREELLAKRVIRKWKKLVNQRRQSYLFQVLYSQIHDINASIVLAKQHAQLLCV